MVDVYDYVGLMQKSSTGRPLFPGQYMTLDDWLTAARTTVVFTYGYANCALHPTLSPQKCEHPAVFLNEHTFFSFSPFQSS